MDTPLSVATARQRDGTYMLVASGEIDLSNISVFTEALNRTIAEAPGLEPVTVNLSAVEYLDSGAINVLFDRVNRVRVIANPVLLPVLHVSGLADLTTVESAPSDGPPA
ncbi:STAS domain-containing protein [Mycolicibacterium mengxianglii]|uniref:STAS domain-containing protein n=1 Tax=Mycolicibacterium mengxianglii TaxID=2736649 RepID=UPI0018D0DBB4|nr:STAS domain-containing protein [Mycolicibacterium mengxianglii]